MTEKDESIFSQTQLGVLGDLFLGTSTSKILDFLLIFREFDYSESDIARSAGISTRHIYRAIPKLEHLKLIENTRTSGRSKMYKINSNSEAIQHLEKFAYLIAKDKIYDETPNIPVQERFKENTPEFETEMCQS
jgi:hypothetical protein